MIKIIVARYNENIEWTKQFPNVLIYNKGPPCEMDSSCCSYTLPNVGREGHTYYTYIYDNYDNLDDYTLFLQGNPFDHSPNVIEKIWNYIRDDNLNLQFENISELLKTCTLDEGLVHGPMREVFTYLFNINTENPEFVFGSGAQFIVSREQIQKRPREFYLKIVELLEYTNHPMEGFAIERMHPYIFSA